MRVEGFKKVAKRGLAFFPKPIGRDEALSAREELECVTEVSEQSELPLEALRRRDAEVFAMLVERHQGVVLGLAQALGLRGADLDDAAAEVFANVFRALPRFEGRSSLGTWVYRIACRTIPKVRARYRPSPGQAMTQAVPNLKQPSPLQESETAERNRRVWDAVAALDGREALAIEMCYRRGWPVSRIAQVLECPEGTVKTLLFRARQKLRRSLDSMAGEANERQPD